MIKTQLYQNKHGIFYLRIRDKFGERRVSIHTRDQNQAKIVLNLNQFEQLKMLIDPKKIKEWTLKKSADGAIEIATEDNDSDRASAIRAVELLANALPSRAEIQAQKNLKAITLAEAVLRKAHRVVGEVSHTRLVCASSTRSG